MPAESLDGAPSLWSSVTHTAKTCYEPDSRMAPLTCAPSLTTPLASMAHFGAGASMCSQGAFPVSRLASLGDVWRARIPVTAGHIQPALLARLDPQSRSWRTCQGSLPLIMGDTSGVSLVTWPRSGMMRAGQCLELPTSARHISATDCGSTPIYPTPCARDFKDCAAPSESRRKTPSLASRVGGPLSPMWVEWLMGWPVGATALEPLVMANVHNRPWLPFSTCTPSLQGGCDI